MTDRPSAATSPPLPLLRLDEVRKSFRTRVPGPDRMLVLDGVSFSLAAGDVVGLVGGSGVGKSTVARLVLGLSRPDSGQILFEGRDVARLDGRELREVRRRMHLIFQDPYDALPPTLRVREIVAEPLTIHRIGTAAERAEQARAALESVSLAPAARFAERYPHELSGGERQRVALARAVILQPSLIVADEPTTMLDVSLRLELLALMRDLQARHGTAYLYITHDLALARAFCDRLIILHRGRVAEEGPSADVIERPSHPYTAALIAAAVTLPTLDDSAVPDPTGEPALAPPHAPSRED